MVLVASSLSLLGSTKKSPWVCTVTSQCLPGYDRRCFEDMKLQQSTNQPWLYTVHIPGVYCVYISRERESMPYTIRDQVIYNMFCLFAYFRVYVLATSMVVSGWLLSCDNAHSRCFNSAAPLRDWHHNLISHLVTLSWHWAKQSLTYPNN